MKSFKIALAQFSPHTGNFELNAQKMVEQANEAKNSVLILLFSRTVHSRLLS